MSELENQEQINDESVNAPSEEIEIIDNNQNEEIIETQENLEPVKKEFDPKRERVDFSTPEQQAKFNDVYKQMKMADSRNQMLTELLQKQQEQLDALNNRFHRTDEADAEKILTNKIINAKDVGDINAEIAAINELTEFKARKIAQESLIKTKPREQNVQDGDVRYIESLQQETDASGNPVRPWLNQTHPQFNEALSALEQIKHKYIGDIYAIPKAMADLDAIMNKKSDQIKKVATQNRVPNPMQGSNLTNQKFKAPLKMTKVEMEIARKLGVDPKAYANMRDAENAKRKEK